MEVNMYIGFWTLKMKCTHYGLYEQTAFKQGQLYFSKSGGAGNNFRSGLDLFVCLFVHSFIVGCCLKVLDCGPWPPSTSP